MKTHISENEDAYFRERRRIKTKTQKNESAEKQIKPQKQKKTKTHKNEDAKGRISIGAIYKSLQIINSSFIYKNIQTAFGNKYIAYYFDF